MKYMNMKEKFWKIDLQLFAGDEEDGSEGDGEGEEGEEDDSEEDGSEEKKFTQKDVDEAVKKRLARERRKWQRGQQNAKNNSKESEETEETDQEKRVREAEEKASALEMKWTCLEHDVKKNCVDDVLALAKVYVSKDETLDIEDAIDKVLEKYPQFKEGQGEEEQEGEQGEEQKKKGWGQRHGGDPSKKKTVDDVIKEKLFGK